MTRPAAGGQKALLAPAVGRDRPVVQALAAVAERLVGARLRPGDVAVERDLVHAGRSGGEYNADAEVIEENVANVGVESPAVRT